MGTRADFYVGRGNDAEWLGSLAWDGYPDGIEDAILGATTDDEFKAAVLKVLQDRDDGTTPEMGWPWPWDTSNTTDFAYAIEDGKVWASCFGGNWFDPLSEENEDGERAESDVRTNFPNMKDRKNMTMGPRSGVIVIG
jgi:hypothetical protein